MFPKIKKLIILLTVLCFWTGCTQVKQVVTDVKEGVSGALKKDTKDTPKAPAEKKEPPKDPEPADKGTTTVNKEESSPPAKAKKKETKTTTPAGKKGSTSTTPSGEVFGPK